MQRPDSHPPPPLGHPRAGWPVQRKVEAERPAPADGGAAARAASTWEHRAGDTNRLTRQLWVPGASRPGRLL